MIKEFKNLQYLDDVTEEKKEELYKSTIEYAKNGYENYTISDHISEIYKPYVKPLSKHTLFKLEHDIYSYVIKYIFSIKEEIISSYNENMENIDIVIYVLKLMFNKSKTLKISNKSNIVMREYYIFNSNELDDDLIPIKLDNMKLYDIYTILSDLRDKKYITGFLIKDIDNPYYVYNPNIRDESKEIKFRGNKDKHYIKINFRNQRTLDRLFNVLN